MSCRLRFWKRVIAVFNRIPVQVTILRVQVPGGIICVIA